MPMFLRNTNSSTDNTTTTTTTATTTTTTRMSRDWKGDWDDDVPSDENDDDDDDLAPLVRSSVKPLELSAPSIRRREQRRSDKRRSRTTILVILLFIVLSLGVRLHYRKKPSKTKVADDENDDNTCTSNNKSTEALLERVEGSLNFCDEIVSFPQCRTWYYHSNFGPRLL
jgi:hypothetical protein